MATTELHKVPDTILSRCQEFEFRTIPLKKIRDRLALIANAEGIEISEEALAEVARSGEGSMRDAQSNFDQVISFSTGAIGEDDVTSALGLASVTLLMRTLDGIKDRNPAEILAIVDELNSRGHDLRSFCRDLLGLFRDLLVGKVSGFDSTLLEGASIGAEALRESAGRF